MKKSLGFICFILLIVCAQTYLSVKEQRLRQSIQKQVEDSLHSLMNESGGQETGSSGMQSLKYGTVLRENFIQRYIAAELPEANSHPLIWHSGDETDIIALSALGTDRLHHFSNSYLDGFLPFSTDQMWIPQYTLAMRMDYKRDSDQYVGMNDIWQSSKEAFRNIYGDCEDHAILLADWLINLGLDARVVLGEYSEEGHAWVVVFRDGQVFLIEATSKRKIKKWQHYPIAGVAYQYHPEYMFNREFFWMNTGSTLTTNYQSMDWVKRSRRVGGS